MFSIKALIPSYPLHRLGTSQTEGCASEPSGVHPLSCPCNLVNTFQMSLMEIMCGLGRRGYRQLLLGPVRKTLSAKYTTVTTAAASKPVLILGGGGWGCSEVCNRVRREKKQTADLLIV